MLSRRSIHTKLTIVFSLMIAVVLLLASSAFWGLYSYRCLANGISHLASEMPYANQMSQSAQNLREAGERLWRLREENQLLEPHTLFGASRIEFETDGFTDALTAFDRSLKEYEALISHSDGHQELFVDSIQRERILTGLGQQHQAIDQMWKETPVIKRDDVSFDALRLELDKLADQTTELSTMMQQGMAAYSTDVRSDYRTAIAIAWTCLFSAIAMVCLLLLLLRSLVIKPFQTLLDGSRLVASGQFNHRIDLGTGDELSELAGVMNQMTDRFQRTCGMLERERADLDKQVRDRSREVIQREQLASVGFLAAGVAHEINNPLASIAWSAEALECRLHDVIHSDADTRSIAAEDAKALGENLRRVQDEAYRCKGITKRLLDFSRLGDCERSQVDIGELIRDVVAMVGTLGKYKCKTLRTHCDGIIMAHVNGQQIRQVALNLITNALESVDTDGAVDVSITRQGNSVRVAVEDDGCGMTEEVLEHLFEPFFTRRRDGSGTGLGLSITHRIVTQHGGKLTAHSAGPGLGSRLQFEVSAEQVSDHDDLQHSYRHKEEINEPLRAA